jgi:hypothetical protein
MISCRSHCLNFLFEEWVASIVETTISTILNYLFIFFAVFNLIVHFIHSLLHKHIYLFTCICIRSL